MKVPEKIEAAQKLFKEGKDSREVARELGYSSPNSLGAMMRRKGYRWDTDAQNYVKAGQSGDVNTLLEERAQELEALLDWFRKSNGSPGEPRIRRVPGPTVTKGFRLPVEVDKKLSNYCNRKVLHQKDVLITAILEFLDRYDD